jgi:lysophospholipase L1-like esterase
MNSCVAVYWRRGLGSALAVLDGWPRWRGRRRPEAEVPARPSFGMVAEPCPPPLDLPPPVQAFNAAFIAPGKVDMPRMLALTKDPAFVAYNAAKSRARRRRLGGAVPLPARQRRHRRVGPAPQGGVLRRLHHRELGDGRSGLFGADVIGRGIGGQTTAQMLVRFRSDVIDLRPRVVQILAGTNDIAGNKGPTSEREFQNNIMAMVELARAHRIRVVLASIPPARSSSGGRRSPGPEIDRLNSWLRDYARREKLTFIDYHAALVGSEGAMRAGPVAGWRASQSRRLRGDAAAGRTRALSYGSIKRLDREPRLP